MSIKERDLVSIVIPSYYSKKKNPEILFSCLRSISSSTYTNYEIIVVDDNSEIYLSSLLSTLQIKEKVAIIRNERNLGYAASCNRGAAVAKGEFILFLNDDMMISSDLLEVLVREAKKHPNMGILFCKEISYSNPNIVSTGCLMDSFGNTLARRNPQSGLVFYAPGAPCFMKAEVFREVMGFDESFSLFFEDVDLSWRVRLNGYSINYIDKAFVRHLGSATIKGFSSQRVFLYQRNALRSFLKNLGLKSLPIFLAKYIIQSCLLSLYFSLMRKPEIVFSIFKAHLSNLKDLKNILIQRRIVQSTRKINDSDIMKYISRGWFLFYRFRKRI